MIPALLRFAALLTATVAAAGCGSREPAQAVTPGIDIAAVVRKHRHLREQTQRRFAEAAFLSPQPDFDADIPLWMAPLLVHEYSTAPADEPRWAKFGAVTVDSTGRATVDCDQPTVYLLAAEIMIGSQSLKQLTYWWFYPPVAHGQPIRFRGFRMTLGNGGYGVVWDVVSSDSGDRVFYVSKPVEQAAAEQYGGPLPGRRFVVEPPVKEHPEVIVPRIVGDGPQPMGPFVYLEASSLEATTLICRCEPSQVDKFPHSSHYRLQRIDSPRNLYGGDSPPSNLRLPPTHVSPEEALRLPHRL